MTYETETCFGDKTEDKGKIYFHRTLKGMRNILTRIGHDDPSLTLACCWRCYPKRENRTVAEIHYALEVLSVDIVAHEATHACLHRMRLVGAKDEDWVEEETATISGLLTEYAYRAWQKVKRLEKSTKPMKSKRTKINV